MALSFRKPAGLDEPNEAVVHVELRRELPRLLAFAGWSIDDVVNNPLAKRDVYNWYRMSLNMKRRLDVLALERQWNPHQ